MRKPPTGEPYAGKPHVRFGGRGGLRPFPTPIVFAFAGDDVRGSNDELTGNQQRDVLIGDGKLAVANDDVEGGDDMLNGSVGNDVLYGDYKKAVAGDDHERGADTFVFNLRPNGTSSTANGDIIWDFDDLDTIDLMGGNVTEFNTVSTYLSQHTSGSGSVVVHTKGVYVSVTWASGAVSGSFFEAGKEFDQIDDQIV